MNTREQPGGNIDVQGEILKAMIGVYYSRALASPDTARDRARSAYTLSSAIAAALVAAGVVTVFRDRPFVVQATGVVAVLAWCAAAYLYLRAIAAPVASPAARNFAPQEWVASVLADAYEERSEIDRRQRDANTAGICALLVTMISFGLALFPSDPPVEARGIVQLTPLGALRLDDICPGVGSEIDGDIELDSVGAEFTVITEVTSVGCSIRELRIPRSAIAVVALNP